MKAKMKSWRIPLEVLELLETTIKEYEKRGLYNIHGLATHIVVNGIRNECDARLKALEKMGGKK